MGLHAEEGLFQMSRFVENALKDAHNLLQLLDAVVQLAKDEDVGVEGGGCKYFVTDVF